MTITQETFEYNRINGIGSNFKVINHKDGFRNDGRLWFGECVECGETVTNSTLMGYWEHTVTTVISRHANGNPLHSQTQGFPYCPSVGVV